MLPKRDLGRQRLADARPKLVKAVVAVEPAGPPLQNTVFGTEKARAWGVADIPITYDPPVNDPAELKIEQQAQPDGPDLVRCWQQQAPANRLANLVNIPALATSSISAILDGEIPSDGQAAARCGLAGPRSEELGFAHDSALEGDGFELPVPREMTTIFEPSCFWFL